MSPTPLQSEAAGLISDFRDAPDRSPKIGNGSTVFAFHAKGVAAIALRNRDLGIEPDRSVQPMIAVVTGPAISKPAYAGRLPNWHE
jgi:hypothetical protein